MTAIAAAIAVLTIGAVPASAAGADWTGYLFDARHGSWNAAAVAITPADAAGLTPDWTFTADAPVGDQPPAALVASPTVAGGRVFVGSNTGVLTALDEATGDPLWSRDLGHVQALTCLGGRGITSTATVTWDPSRAQEAVYVAGGDGYLYALAADDGEQLWRSLVVRPGVTENAGYDWASPIVVNGSVFMGVSSMCDRPLVRGGLKRYDQASGALSGTYWTMPRGEIGASVWTSPASRSGDLWFTTGNSRGGGQPGDSYSMLRLRASSLEREDRWVVPGADKDLDWGSSPTLFEGRVGGELQNLVGACSKSGRYYALRAGDLREGPVWSRKLGIAAGEPGGGSCLAATIWDAGRKQLIAGANRTTLEGVTVAGSLRALSPRDGSVRWATALPAGPVIGSPTLNGAGVVAAGTYDTTDPASNAVYLVDADDGTILRTIVVTSPVFAQPVFAGSHLFVADTGGTLTAYS